MVDTVSTRIVLDTRRTLKDGTYPVKLRITHNREQKYYTLGVSMTEEGFARTQGENPRGEYKKLQLKFSGVEQKARAVIDKLDVFTFPIFNRKYKNSVGNVDVFSTFNTYIANLKKEDRIGTAMSYSNACNSLQAFHAKKSLPFTEVDPDFLKSYERFMLGKGRSITTVGIYLRSLKAIYNYAIAEGIVNEMLYPFGKRSYIVPPSNNVKKALSLSDIKRIFEYEPSTDSEAQARDFWLFSYLTNGINMIDIAGLRYRNISAGFVTVVRSKSKNTRRKNVKPIVAVLTPESERIIERWGNQPAVGDSYVFPIFTESLTAVQRKACVKKVVKRINKYMDRIAKALELDCVPTTYWARHSYSNVLMNAGASTQFISMGLGHSNVQITANYLSSFETEEIKKYAVKLTEFKK